jgi:dienelactone hydrolase
MIFTSQTTSDGVSESHFTLDDIPGVLWSPPDAPHSAVGRPVVLLIHGGGQHKTAPTILGRVSKVTDCGFAAVALDAPGSGDRPRSERDEQFVTELRRRMAAGEPAGPEVARYNAEVAAQAVPEWQAVLTALQESGQVAENGGAGVWGMSLGAAIGLPLAAADPRIKAAVLGLASHENLAKAAAQVTVPVQFLVQWDDEMVPRDEALTLFDTFASPAKTLHANPGRHAAVPAFEWASAAEFFARHLAPVQ